VRVVGVQSGVGPAGGLGHHGQGGLQLVGEHRVEHGVQMGQVTDAGDAHHPPALGADLVLVPVGPVQVGQQRAELLDLTRAGLGGQQHQLRLVGLQHVQPTHPDVFEDHVQVGGVRQPGGVRGRELGEVDQVPGQPRQPARVVGAAAQDGGGERAHRRAAGVPQLPGPFGLDQHLRLRGLQHRDRLLQCLCGLVSGQQPRAVDQALGLVDHAAGCRGHDPSQAPATDSHVRVQACETPYPTGIRETLPKRPSGS
jgi:hypothetical protein